MAFTAVERRRDRGSESKRERAREREGGKERERARESDRERQAFMAATDSPAVHGLRGDTASDDGNPMERSP